MILPNLIYGDRTELKQFYSTEAKIATIKNTKNTAKHIRKYVRLIIKAFAMDFIQELRSYTFFTAMVR
jgi:hypothetical protein